MIATNLLAGDRVRLTPLRKDDVADVLRWQEDTRFLRLWDSDPLTGRTEAQVTEWMDDLGKTEREVSFAIRLLNDPKIIGVAGLDGIEWTHRVAGLNIGIGDPDEWGKGYGTEATKLLIDYAFRELNLYRLQLSVFAFNTRAIALYERMEFQREGSFREFVERDGKRFDMYLYGLLRTEWNGGVKRNG